MSTSLPCKEITKIVASDLDGTLLAPNHQLSAYSKETLKALHEKVIPLSLQPAVTT